jgi:hypothetical protein
MPISVQYSPLKRNICCCAAHAKISQNNLFSLFLKPVLVSGIVEELI